VTDLWASIPRSSLIIDDLAHLSNDDLKARSLGAFQKLALWLLRDARTPRQLLDNFDTWIATFAEAERAPAGIDAIATLLTYMFRVIGGRPERPGVLFGGTDNLAHWTAATSMLRGCFCVSAYKPMATDGTATAVDEDIAGRCADVRVRPGTRGTRQGRHVAFPACPNVGRTKRRR